jgi:hypothetical protein
MRKLMQALMFGTTLLMAAGPAFAYEPELRPVYDIMALIIPTPLSIVPWLWPLGFVAPDRPFKIGTWEPNFYNLGSEIGKIAAAQRVTPPAPKSDTAYVPSLMGTLANDPQQEIAVIAMLYNSYQVVNTCAYNHLEYQPKDVKILAERIQTFLKYNNITKEQSDQAWQMSVFSTAQTITTQHSCAIISSEANSIWPGLFDGLGDKSQNPFNGSIGAQAAKCDMAA